MIIIYLNLLISKSYLAVPMSFLKYIPSKLTFSIFLYAFSLASSKVFPLPTTESTLPPLVTKVFPSFFAPAIKNSPLRLSSILIS